MNILYRQLSELTVNEISFEKRLEFYQTHYYDNIYISFQTVVSTLDLKVNKLKFKERNYYVNLYN